MAELERHHLRVLREVSRQGTLTAASKSLGLTQSALSHSIRALEEHLEAEIWVREGRGLRWTQAGEHLLQVAERLLPQLEQAEEQAQRFAQGTRGSLRIGMECHPCYRWLLQVVAPYLKRYPEVDLDVRQKFQFGGVGALFSREIDLLVTPDPLEHPGLLFQPVFDYELRLVVGKNHRLARKRRVSPEQLAEETLITYPVEVERLDIYSKFLLPAGIVPKSRKTIETTDIMLQMVASGRGITALPGWLAKEYDRRLKLRSLRLGSGVKKSIHVARRKGEENVAHLDAFIRLAKKKRASSARRVE